MNFDNEYKPDMDDVLLEWCLQFQDKVVETVLQFMVENRNKEYNQENRSLLLEEIENPFSPESVEYNKLFELGTQLKKAMKSYNVK